MKHILSISLVILTQLTANRVLAEPSPASPPTMKLSLDLVDGSRIVGVPTGKDIKLQTDSTNLNLAWSLIRSVAFGTNHQSAVISLANGDRLSGTLTVKDIELKTAFGTIEIPVAKIQRATFSSGVVALDGLILHYSFDRQTDGKVADQTGSNPPAQLHGSAQIIADGKIGSGLQLAADGGYVTFPDLLLPMENAPRTVALWFKTAGCPSHPQILFDYGQNTGGSLFHVIIYESSSILTLGEYGNRHPKGNGYKNVTDDKWHQVALVYDGHQKAAIYLDGELDFTTPRNYATSPRGTGYLSQPPVGHFVGALDEFMVFNRALSAEEVKSLYDAQK